MKKKFKFKIEIEGEGLNQDEAWRDAVFSLEENQLQRPPLEAKITEGKYIAESKKDQESYTQQFIESKNIPYDVAILAYTAAFFSFSLFLLSGHGPLAGFSGFLLPIGLIAHVIGSRKESSTKKRKKKKKN